MVKLLDSIYLEYFENSLKAFESLLKDKVFLDKLKKTAMLISEAIKNNHKILTAGNGGSAADAQHITTEFIVRLDKKDYRKALPAIALTTNSSVITAGANDLGFSNIFSRQVEGLGNEGDIFWGISTSGYSENILNALKIAKAKGLKTVLLTGNHKIKDNWDIIISVPSHETNIIQIAHSLIEHILVNMVINLTFL